ncbi:hypothetical protein ACIQM0_13875 [Streptomyces sp. NPDC091387]|uniref:hypothetical protein n=1 Tax=Streptomyces sp. NPDC091387 TaxID=3365998 RepID=UPI00382483C1
MNHHSEFCATVATVATSGTTGAARQENPIHLRRPLGSAVRSAGGKEVVALREQRWTYRGFAATARRTLLRHYGARPGIVAAEIAERDSADGTDGRAVTRSRGHAVSESPGRSRDQPASQPFDDKGAQV